MPLTAEQLVKGIENVASLPTIYQRLNEVVNDSRSSNRDVARILSEDAGLAPAACRQQRLLRQPRPDR
jgi:HD-like signal output (HDOD) protein